MWPREPVAKTICAFLRSCAAFWTSEPLLDVTGRLFQLHPGGPWGPSHPCWVKSVGAGPLGEKGPLYNTLAWEENNTCNNRVEHQHICIAIHNVSDNWYISALSVLTSSSSLGFEIAILSYPYLKMPGNGVVGVLLLNHGPSTKALFLSFAQPL